MASILAARCPDCGRIVAHSERTSTERDKAVFLREQVRSGYKIERVPELDAMFLGERGHAADCPKGQELEAQRRRRYLLGRGGECHPTAEEKAP